MIDKREKRIRNIYYHMIYRTENPLDKDYIHYGARGIKVCNEWRNDFKSFYNWAIKNGYQDNLTIDRENVNGDYEPSNCRWITREENNMNKTNTIYISYNGKRMRLIDWSKELNISYDVLKNRIVNLKWEVERAFTEDVHSNQGITFEGKTQSIRKWAKELGISRYTIQSRLKKGMSVEKALGM